MSVQPLSLRMLAHKAALWLNLCPACTDALNRLFEKQEADDALLPPQGIECAFAAFPYTDAAKTLILLLKYGSIRAAANPLANAMSARFCGKVDILARTRI